jgi:hypothetical protein
MMVKHLPYNEFDMCAITNAVDRYKGAGLRADYNIEQKAAGVVSIVLENPMMRKGSLALFEVHKLARPTWFGQRALWVVQLWSQPLGGKAAEKRGCVTGKTQAHALTGAEARLRTCTTWQGTS